MDQDSLLNLFDSHHLPLFRFAYRMTESTADAEDIVQECFLELLRPGCSVSFRQRCVRKPKSGLTEQILSHFGAVSVPKL